MARQLFFYTAADNSGPNYCDTQITRAQLLRRVRPQPQPTHWDDVHWLQNLSISLNSPLDAPYFDVD